MSINTITLSGNVGRDPEVKYLDAGKAVASLPIAVRGRKRGDEYETLWVEVTFWNQLAQTVADYVAKGRLIGVTGRLEAPDAWQDKRTGDARAKVRVTASSLEFLGPAPDSSSAPQQPQPRKAQPLDDMPF